MWETHPFTFLSLSSFGSCNPIKTTVTLHPQRKMTTLCICTGIWIWIWNLSMWRAQTLGPTSPSFPGIPGAPEGPMSPYKTNDDDHSEQRTQRHPHTTQWLISSNIRHTCSPFLPGRPDLPLAPEFPWKSHTAIMLHTINTKCNLT